MAPQEGNETGVLDEFRHFNGLPEDMESASNRLEDIGTRRSFTNYPWGWAQVGNTPAKRYKQNTHGGGVRDPLIISWPKGIDPRVTAKSDNSSTTSPILCRRLWRFAATICLTP